jgi:hypothetical protein
MRRLGTRMHRLWVTDLALTVLLIFLLLHVFLLYPLAQFGSVKIATKIFFLLILVTGAMAASGNRLFRSLVFSGSFIGFVFIWMKDLFPHEIFLYLNNGLGLFFLVLLTLLILAQTFREGPTTSHRITGAVAGYLLLGLIWSQAYDLIALSLPGAFSVSGNPPPQDAETLQPHLFYFSYVTLTTLGYGDIVAVHPVARTFVILEGVIGQLFPAILISRLVSLHVQEKQKS